jgi:hypothetical protein
LKEKNFVDKSNIYIINYDKDVLKFETRMTLLLILELFWWITVCFYGMESKLYLIKRR